MTRMLSAQFVGHDQANRTVVLCTLATTYFRTFLVAFCSFEVSTSNLFECPKVQYLFLTCSSLQLVEFQRILKTHYYTVVAIGLH